MNKAYKIGWSILWIMILVLGAIWLSYLSPQNQATKASNGNDSGISIGGCFYRLGDKIYCGDKGSILPNVDTASFQVIDHLVAKDKNHVYIIDKITSDMDAQTFHKYEKPGLNLYYLFQDKNGIYNMGFDNKLTPLPLDIETATSVDPFYLKDKNGIYFNDYSITRVDDVDPETFHILGGCASVEKSYAEYAADKDHVFVGTQILPGIDPSHFVEIARIDSPDGEMPYSFYLWKDSSHIYVYCGMMIKEADYATFEYKDGTAQDKNNYYHFNTGGGNYTVQPKT